MDQFDSSNPFTQGQQSWSNDNQHHQGGRPGRNIYQGPSAGPPPIWTNAWPISGDQDEHMSQLPPPMPDLLNTEADWNNLIHGCDTVTADAAPWTGEIARDNRTSPRGVHNRPGNAADAVANKDVDPHYPRKRGHAPSDSGYNSITFNDTGGPPPVGYKFKADGSKSAAQTLPVPGSVTSEPSDGPSSAKRSRVGSKPQLPKCNLCEQVPKNASDAKKHEARHTLPYLCNEPGCCRTKGFANKNDLERHRNSVHLKHRASGYICDACQDPPIGQQKKWWPRKDNFKAHILRKHRDQDVETVMTRSYRDQRPIDAQTVSHASVTQEDNVEMLDEPERQSSNTVLDPPKSPRDDMMSIFGQNNTDNTSGLGAWMGDPDVGGDMGPPPTGLQGSTAYPPSDLDEFFANSLIYTKDGELWSPYDDNNFEGFPPGFESTSIAPLTILDPTPLAEPNTDMTRNVIRVDSNSLPDNSFVCQHCGKTSKRSCELRKHTKRHTRPYGCTFPHCYNRFGSRDDWKRHERQRHYLQESWRCELLNPSGTKCGNLMYNRDTCANHLEEKHGLARGTDQSDRTIESMHMGRQGNDHYWCGFCNELIPVSLDDCIEHGAWEMRFRHIGYHFDKEGKDIEAWVCVERNKPLKLLTEFSRSRDNLKHEAAVAAKDDASEEADSGDIGDYAAVGAAFSMT